MCRRNTQVRVFHEIRFSVARSQIVLHENAPDSALAFVIDGDDYVFVRKVSESYHIFADRVVSDWQAFPGIRVTSVVIPTEYGHMGSMRWRATMTARPMTAVLPWRNLQRVRRVGRRKDSRPAWEETGLYRIRRRPGGGRRRDRSRSQYECALRQHVYPCGSL